MHRVRNTGRNRWVPHPCPTRAPQWSVDFIPVRNGVIARTSAGIVGSARYRVDATDPTRGWLQVEVSDEWLRHGVATALVARLRPGLTLVARAEEGSVASLFLLSLGAREVNGLYELPA